MHMERKWMLFFFADGVSRRRKERGAPRSARAHSKSRVLSPWVPRLLMRRITSFQDGRGKAERHRRRSKWGRTCLQRHT